MKKLLLIALALVGWLAQAANLYWSGLGGDNRWDTADNWATDEALTKKSTAYPTGSDVVCLYTSSFSEHKISIIIPDGAQCGFVYVYDNGAPGTIVFTGEGTRPSFKPNGIYHKHQANQTASGYGTEVDFVNLSLSRFPLGGVGNNTGNNCRIVLDDCLCDCAGAQPTFYTTAGCSVEIRNSTVRNFTKLTRQASAIPFDLKILDSEISSSSYWYVTGNDSSIVVSNSTINLTGQFYFSGASARLSFSETTINQQGSSAAMTIISDNGEVVFDHVNFTGEGSWGENKLQGQGMDTKFICSDIAFQGKSTPKGCFHLIDSVWSVGNGCYSVGDSDESKKPVFVISGKRSRMLPGTYWNTGKADYEFIVPIGGFDQPPVGCDGVLTSVRSGTFLNATVTAKVLPESPAARVGTTAIYPLMYVYTGEANLQRLNLASLTLSELPNDESGFMSCARSDIAFSDVVNQPAEFWSPVEVDSKDNVSGLAVAIVGHDVRPPVIGGFSYAGVADEALNFSLSLTSLGERPEGGSATSVTPTLIYRPVGETAWTEVVQGAITDTGVTTMQAPMSGFSDGNYEIGVRLVNDIGGVTEFVSPGAVEISFSKATLSELTYVGEGDEATISATVTGTGLAQTLPAILEVSEDEGFGVILATYQLGSFATGDVIERAVEINPGVLTYFRVTVGEGSEAGVATVSGTSRTVATIGEITAVNTNGLCRVAVDGSVVSRGAGISTVKLRYSMDGIVWQTNTVGTVAEDGAAFTGDCAFPMTSGTAYYEVLVENSSGIHSWIAEGGVRSLPVKDYSTYYWRAVDEEWNGDWNDGRHWFKPDLPDDITMYPQVDTATASFRDCPANEVVVVTLPANVTVKRVESTTSGQKLTLRGAPEVTLTAQVRLDQENGVNTFDGLSVNDSTSEITITGSGCSYVLASGARMQLKKFGARVPTLLTVGEDCVMTLSVRGSYGSIGNTFLIDNGKLVHAGFEGQNYPSGSITYRLRGKKARVEFTKSESYLNNAWKNVRFVFEIPDGGYDDVPVQLSNGSTSFMTFSNASNLLKSDFGQSGDDNGLIFAVADVSPALLKGQKSAIDQDLFVWNNIGFAKGTDYDLIDYTKLLVPSETSTGKPVTTLAMNIRGIDEVKYESPASLKAANTTAYAIGYHIDESYSALPGLLIIVR